jgi:hypothetical protein
MERAARHHFGLEESYADIGGETEKYVRECQFRLWIVRRISQMKRACSADTQAKIQEMSVGKQ